MGEGAGLSWLLGTYLLQSVTFSGGTNNFFTVVSDNGKDYNAPHYEKTRNKPVAFLKGSKMTVSAKIKLREKFSDDKELIVRLRLNDYIDSAETHTFIIPSENISITKTTFYQQINITDFEIDVTLPNHVYFKEEFEITFDAVIKDKSIGIDDVEEEWWTQVGKTRNDLYVLFGRPHEVGTLFESVLFMTCRNLQVQAAVSQETLLSGIWSLFNSSVVVNRELVIKKGKSSSNDHVLLKYYNPHNTQVTNAKMLLKSDGNGQCGSFASLFIEMLLAHGYPYNDIKFVFYGLNKYWEGHPCGFLVKNWTFSSTGTSNEINGISFTHTNVNRNDGANSHGFSITEVSDAPGVAGQNSSNPASFFGNHQIVGIGSNNNMVYYDPSYGEKYESELEIKNSIDGVYYSSYTVVNGLPKYTFYIKKREAMSVLEIELVPMTYYERLKL